METMNRRQFVTRSAATAAGLTILMDTRKGFSQNETLGAAVVGFNGRGMSHIDAALGIEGVRVVALCDVDETVWPKGVKRVADQQGAPPKTYADIRALLDDDEVDVVFSATPNHWHALVTVWACQAGKDVYIEKPACWGFSEGESMVAAARRHGRIVQVGHQSRGDGRKRNAVARVWSGQIGDVYLSRGLCFKPRGSIGMKDNQAPPATLHWDIWQGPAARREFNPNIHPYNWHWMWAYGNGDIGNQGVHQMDVARWFLNVGLPVFVHSAGGRYGYEDQGETPNTQFSTFRYPDGRELQFEVRGLPTNSEQGAMIGNLVYGSDGWMTEGDGYKAHGAGDEEMAADGLTLPEVGGKGNDIFQNFIDCVRSRKVEELNCEVAEGVLSAQLCCLANISYRVRRSLVFDPVKKVFPGDAEANALLGRDDSPEGWAVPGVEEV